MTDQPSETMIEIQFDKFLAELQWNEIIVTPKLRAELEELEANIKEVMNAVETRVYDDSFSEGNADGWQQGFDEGHSEGYDQCAIDYGIEL